MAVLFCTDKKWIIFLHWNWQKERWIFRATTPVCVQHQMTMYNMNLSVLEIITGYFLCSCFMNQLRQRASGWEFLLLCHGNCVKFFCLKHTSHSAPTVYSHTPVCVAYTHYIMHNDYCSILCSVTQTRVCFFHWLRMETETKMWKYAGQWQQRAMKKYLTLSIKVIFAQRIYLNMIIKMSNSSIGQHFNKAGETKWHKSQIWEELFCPGCQR